MAVTIDRRVLAPFGWRGSVWVRAFGVALAMLVGALGVRHSLGLTLASKSPQFALRLDGENAAAQAQAALVLVQERTDSDSRRKARELARRALARDAGNVTALSALALASDRTDQTAAAFTISERLSRRNLITELWMIETAVAKGDVAQVLQHYDIALRTSRVAPSVLFPLLVNATSDKALLPAIARTLSQRPLWGGLYLQQLAQSGQDLHHIAVLFAILKRRYVATGIAADTALYDRLIAAQLFDDAWNVYVTEHGAASRAGIRNGVFSEQTTTVTPFDWQVNDNEFVMARVEQISSQQGELVFTTAAGEGGEAAKQVLALMPGAYMVEVSTDRIEAADALPPYVQLVCMSSKAELLRKPLAAQGMTGARFSVPAGCSAQTLSLVVQPASSLATVSGAVRRIRLVRIV